jgi:hypothetical protein
MYSQHIPKPSGLHPEQFLFLPFKGLLVSNGIKGQLDRAHPPAVFKKHFKYLFVTH